jgi:hypothetical protein
VQSPGNVKLQKYIEAKYKVFRINKKKILNLFISFRPDHHDQLD